MCAEENNEKCKEKSENNCCEEFAETIKNCCPEGKAADFCAQMRVTCGSGVDSNSEFMDMCQQMKDKFCNQTKDAGNSAGQQSCCG